MRCGGQRACKPAVAAIGRSGRVRLLSTKTLGSTRQCPVLENDQSWLNDFIGRKPAAPSGQDARPANHPPADERSQIPVSDFHSVRSLVDRLSSIFSVLLRLPCLCPRVGFWLPLPH